MRYISTRQTDGRTVSFEHVLGEPLPVQVGVENDDCRPGIAHRLRVVTLVVVSGVRIGDEDGRATRRGEFGQGRCPGATDHEVGPCEPGRHVVDERQYFDSIGWIFAKGQAHQ